MKRLKLIPFLFLIACQNLSDVEPGSRNTLIHFYGGFGNFEAKGIEVIDDGYILVGDSLASNNGIGRGIVIIKTDFNGKTIWRKLFNDGSVNAIKPISDGYLIIGDNIEVDPTAEQLADQVKRKLWLIKIDASGNILLSKTFGTFSPINSERKDIRGHALAIKDDNSIFVTGTIRYSGSRAQAFIAQHDPATLDTLWSKKYDLDNRDYINGKSLHITESDKLIWTTSATLDLANVSRSYVSIPVLRMNSTFDNSQVFGRTDEATLSFYGNDIQPSSFGYSVIGTYKSLTGENSNIYFLSTDRSGNIIPGSDHYYDGGSTSIKINAAEKSNSVAADEGSALITASDGNTLLGASTTTTTEKGNGGKDILLLKINNLGEIVWSKLIGGSGDESVSTIRNTSDNGFVVCGTVDLAGQKQMFILKIDANGDLND